MHTIGIVVVMHPVMVMVVMFSWQSIMDNNFTVISKSFYARQAATEVECVLGKFSIAMSIVNMMMTSSMYTFANCS
jgi:hypothetical protein